MTNLIMTTQLLSGFLIIFFGVYMLNYASKDLDSPEFERLAGGSVPGSPRIPGTRFSMQGLRPSGDMRRQRHPNDEEGDGYILRSLTRRSEDAEPVDESR